jgi:hypothetical protein
MKEKKLFNFRLPVDLIQQIDEFAENRTEFLIKSLQQSIQMEKNRSLLDHALSPDLIVNQPYLQEYINHLKQEITDWKTEANRLNSQLEGLYSHKKNLSKLSRSENIVDITETSNTTIEKTNIVDYHDEIDRVLNMMDEKELKTKSINSC